MTTTSHVPVKAAQIDRLLGTAGRSSRRLVVFSDHDAWMLTFRSMIARSSFGIADVRVDWTTTAATSDADSTPSWLLRSIQPSPTLIVWDADSLRIGRITKGMRRCRGLAPDAVHFVVGRKLTSIDRLRWSQLGVAATLRSPQDLWAQRRLIAANCS